MTIEQLRSIGVDGALSHHGFPSIRELENLSPTPRNLGLVVLLTVTAVLWAPVATPGRAETSSPLPHDPKKPSHETDEVDPTFEERVIVTARADDMSGVADSATEGATGYQDLEKRPILRVGELMETVPGVIATQHSGGGKANQYFLRGFNLDHGTDLSMAVDGMPVNLPTHGHGQGYADLNFLIPELIESIRFRKGTYFVDAGDFSAAGSTDVLLKTSLRQASVRAALGVTVSSVA